MLLLTVCCIVVNPQFKACSLTDVSNYRKKKVGRTTFHSDTAKGTVLLAVPLFTG